MRPFIVLLGFVLGSSVSISFALAATAAIFMLLQSGYPRLSEEIGPLLLNLAIFGGLTAVAAISFYGELKVRRWRHLAAVILGATLLGVVTYYWP